MTLNLFFQNFWLDLLVMIAIIIGILLIYKIVIFLVKRAARSGKIPLGVVNGLKLLVRLIMAIAIIILIVIFTQLPPEITLAISAITGTIIGFASIQALQNFISGLYIVITRPFGVNDLVAIGNIEGLVSEISLNYTKIVTASGKRILLSNRNVLNSNLTNYTIQATEKTEKNQSKLKWFKLVFLRKEITRYAFSLELTRQKPKKLKTILGEAVEAWESEFGYKPQFFLWRLDNFAVYRFILIADNPETILKKYPLFIKDIYRRVYSKSL